MPAIPAARVMPALLAVLAILPACGAFGTDDTEAPNAAGAASADPEYQAPLELAKGLLDPRGVALDEGFVYYTVEGGGTVHAVRRDGSEPRIVAANKPDVRDVVVDGSRIYWAARGTNGGCNGGNRGVESVRKDGTDPLRLFDSCENNVRLGADALDLYFSTKEGSVWRLAKDGASQKAIVKGAEQPNAVASSGPLVFWVSNANGTVHAYDGVAPAPEVLAANQPAPTDVAAEGATVYWVNAGGTVMKLDTSAGRTPATLATGQASPARLAMNATHLFWTNAGDGTIASVRKAGGEVRTIARDQRMPLAIAADADAVAWTCLGDGSVRVLRRR